jgi:hypothetical protein
MKSNKAGAAIAALVSAFALPGCSTTTSTTGSVFYSVNPKDVVPTVTANGGNSAVQAEASSSGGCEKSNMAAGTLAAASLETGGVETMKLEGISNPVLKQPAVRSAANLYVTSKTPSATQPGDISYSDFIDLPGLLNGMKKAGDRTAFYELQYFKGHFIDHFGNSITPSQVTEKNQDQEIQNLLTVLLDSVFDDIEEYQFQKRGQPVPYWSSTDATTATSSDYYLSGKSMGSLPTLPITPGGPTATADFASLQNLSLVTPSSKIQVPTFIAYAYYRYYMKQYPNGQITAPQDNTYSLRVTNSKMEVGGNGCGMNQTKANVLLYLSRRAGALTGGEAGALLGAIGGADIGPVIVLGKVSIGDNQTLKSIVQAFLTETAERATLASAREHLLRTPIPDNTVFAAALDSLVQKTANSSSPSNGSGESE